MSSVPHPNPRLAEAGIEIGTPAQAGSRDYADMTTKRPPPEVYDSRSPIADAMPGARTLRTGFREIAVPDGLSIEAGASAAYVLRRWRCPTELPEGIIFGIGIEALAADVDGAATPSTGTALAWGDVRGESAAIIIDRDFPVEPGGWRSVRANVPGIETASGLLIDNSRDYIGVYGFPPGKFSDSAPSKLYQNDRWAPAAHKLVRGQTLSAVLVVRRSFIHGLGAARRLVGNVRLSIMFAPVFQDQKFSAR